MGREAPARSAFRIPASSTGLIGKSTSPVWMVSTVAPERVWASAAGADIIEITSAVAAASRRHGGTARRFRHAQHATMDAIGTRTLHPRWQRIKLATDL